MCQISLKILKYNYNREDHMKYFAHTKEDLNKGKVLPKSEWQPLTEHLNSVARLAENNAEKFGAGKFAKIVGLAHDLGKYSMEFQKRLEGSLLKVNHSTAGAQEIFKTYPQGGFGKILAFIVAGHHGGLPDGHRGDSKNLPERLIDETIPDYQYFKNEIELPKLVNKDLQNLPNPKDSRMKGFSKSFCIRMIYSCLVDADFLDTEKFMDVAKFSHRTKNKTLAEIYLQLEKKLQTIKETNLANLSKINIAREKILQRCLDMAEQSPNLFTLTVPTGGGKTLSSLAFALKHAIKHGKDRIIYAIPYTSIIEQNADVFRNALEDDYTNPVVLEHHSNFEYPESDFQNWNSKEKKYRLASENWDMPIIVTTTVQFFESLYANKSSRCRKLHNLVNSVIILDEAQLIPLESFKPCLWAIAELVLNYKATIVFCTATQPVIESLLPANLKPIEIIEEPEELYQEFRRVKVNYIGEKSDDELVEKIVCLNQNLTIVNTRNHAMILFKKLQEISTDGIYHLSAKMCPRHRKKVLAEIKSRLSDNLNCHVVSTQLIEAGVDIDFPYVFRSATGIDSIAQAAGRCNREGKLPFGEVSIFYPEKHGMPDQGNFSLVAGLMKETARNLEKFDHDLLSLKAVKDFSKKLLSLKEKNLDEKQILEYTDNQIGQDLTFPFATISKNFQMVDGKTIGVVVPYDETIKEIMYSAKYNSHPLSLARKLQPYTVKIYNHELIELERKGAITKICDIFLFIHDDSFYDDKIGLKIEPSATKVLIF